MRALISFKQTVTQATARPNKHALQGMIYTLLKATEYNLIHEKNHVKLFSFSDWFRRRQGGYYFFISSPDDKLIHALADVLKKNIGDLKFLDYVLTGVEVFDTKVTRLLKTASPVVLVRDGKRNEYHSFKKRTLSIQEFDKLIKEGLERRYRIYTGDSGFELEGPLFEALDLRNEIPVRVDIRGREFIVIGSTWNKLILARNKSRTDFYKWLIDAGIGQKNSLGFGCLQPYRLGSARNKYQEGVKVV